MKKINTRIISSKKKLIVLLLVVFILLIASQWWSITMVYDRKFNDDTALFFARIYRLKAGQAVNANEKINISLASYIADEKFAFDYLKKQSIAKSEEFNMSDQQVRDIAWEKVLRQHWINVLAKKNNIKITDQDISDFYNSAGGKKNLQAGLKSAQVNLGQYEDFVVKPSIMEAKVYKYLLDNFNDLAGMQKAQNAYKALVDDKGKFEDIAKQFSDDMTYVENSMFVSIDELGEFGEPIKNLKAGEYSKILVLPGNPGYYVIWRLQGSTIDPETKKDIKELRGIAIKAKSMDEFFADWKNNTTINQWYK